VTLHTPFAYLALPDGLRDRLLAHAEWITAVSHSLLEELHSVAPFTRDRSSVALNALPEPPQPPVPLCFEPATLLAVGRLVPEKGFDVALRAFAQLVAHFPGLRFIVVGDGPERGALESLAAALVPADAVTFLGWIDPERMPAMMNGATIVLMPSRWDEPFGLVAVEAAQMARPIVGSRVGGLPEIVVEGVTGLLIDAGDAEAMAVATASLLRDPQRAQQLGYEARLRIRERFSIQSCADAYDAAYVRAVAVAGARGRSDASEPEVSAAKT
jgi:glycogen(starch) synthase